MNASARDVHVPERVYRYTAEYRCHGLTAFNFSFRFSLCKFKPILLTTPMHQAPTMMAIASRGLMVDGMAKMRR